MLPTVAMSIRSFTYCTSSLRPIPYFAGHTLFCVTLLTPLGTFPQGNRFSEFVIIIITANGAGLETIHSSIPQKQSLPKTR